MKNYIQKMFTKLLSGMMGGIGLMLGVVVFMGITYAAVTITTTSVTPGTPMTASLWNAVKTDLDNLAAEFNDIGNFNNVTLTSLAADDILAYDGTNWINQANASGGGAGSIDWGDCETFNGNVYSSSPQTLVCSSGYTIIDLSCAGLGSNSYCNYVNNNEIVFRQTDNVNIKCCRLN